MTAGRPKGHVPMNKGRSLPGRRNSVKSASSAVRDLFDAIDDLESSTRVIGVKAGVHFVTLSKWRNGHAAPLITDFESVAQSIGYRIVLVPIDDSCP